MRHNSQCATVAVVTVFVSAFSCTTSPHHGPRHARWRPPQRSYISRDAIVRAYAAAGVPLVFERSTPVRGNQPTTNIVRSGPYRFSRNPIYSAFTLLQLGIATVSASLWVLVAVVPAVAFIGLRVIPREEQYLEAKFGDEYLKYKSSVRRWL